MKDNELSSVIIGIAIDIHKRLGPGLLESVYQHVLAYELRKQELDVIEEMPIPVYWDSQKLEVGFRADLVVEGKIIVELKSVEKVSSVHKKVLLTYLRIADKRLGLIINFREDLLKNGIHRVVNNFNENGPTSN